MLPSLPTGGEYQILKLHLTPFPLGMLLCGQIFDHNAEGMVLL
jgi:hypothetical protein